MHRPSSSPHSLGASSLPILISGASFAGLALAHWLIRLGHCVTIVEIAPGLRRGGTPVDIEGETIEILARMGLLEEVLAKALAPRRFAFKAEDDTTLGTFGGDAVSDGTSAKRYEIHRDDLLDVLFAAVYGSVDLRFGHSISRLDQSADRVAVTFDDGTRQDYAFVFGCDGNRSRTRGLVFGDFATSSCFMGAYFYLKVVPQTGLLAADTSEVFSAPGRTAMLNGYDDRTDICLAFRVDRPIEGLRDRAKQRRLIHDHFDGLGWKVPEMLCHVDDGDDFYFDQINQIRIAQWSKDRVALVGDAGYCVSPVAGMGGSMAIIGAARLADALRNHPGDHVAAFREYEETLRPLVDDVQRRAVEFGMTLMFPADEHDLAERDRKLQAGDIAL